MPCPVRMARCVVALLTVVLAPLSAEESPARAHPEPVAPMDFVALADIDPTIGQDIRYFSAHNFIGDRVDGYRAPMCILTLAAAEGLKRAQRRFVELGYTLKVYDCYRPQRAVDDFVRWAGDLGDQRMKAEFYPRLDKASLFRDGYIADHSGHSRGSTVDLTLVKLPALPTRAYLAGEPLIDCTAPVSVRFPDDSIDMGSGFDCFDTLAHTRDARIQGDQLRNRVLLESVLQSQGFVNYESEWWHFTYQPEPYPATYFDFPIEPASLADRK
ncbi:M15 family metallopeptidase [Mycobacterium spongiae]|uniref:D-alanyl-D-alanine dipeptidase n=1 Tax=Mycobacterium spongiae TaxID=886343 RepID=A0A975JUL7_9MYCO|nr:M15 family metallopeptidase [Mycobacterium spongiae]QUR65994.1 D-alanyl-D-alanine dipeptidase [Mycobacterium spongiae]